MILFKTKSRVFTSYPLRKPEIMESYSVSFHNFRFPAGEIVKNTRRWLQIQHSPNVANRSDLIIDRKQTIIEIHRDSSDSLPLRMHKPIFCNTLEIFLYCRRQFYYSRLTRLRAELVAGANYRELVQWLRQTHRIKIAHTSVMCYLVQLLDCQEKKDAELPTR